MTPKLFHPMSSCWHLVCGSLNERLQFFHPLCIHALTVISLWVGCPSPVLEFELGHGTFFGSRHVSRSDDVPILSLGLERSCLSTCSLDFWHHCKKNQSCFACGLKIHKTHVLQTWTCRLAALSTTAPPVLSILENQWLVCEPPRFFFCDCLLHSITVAIVDQKENVDWPKPVLKWLFTKC